MQPAQSRKNVHSRDNAQKVKGRKDEERTNVQRLRQCPNYKSKIQTPSQGQVCQILAQEVRTFPLGVDHNKICPLGHK